MSVTQIIASDYPLPLIERDGICIEERDFPHGMFGDGTDEADDYVNREYKYSFTLEATEKCVILLRDYLNRYMKNVSEVEFWSIWLGAGFKDYNKYQPRLGNISADEYTEIMVGIDDYIDSVPTEVKKKYTSVEELTEDDIEFLNKNFYVCLSVKK